MYLLNLVKLLKYIAVNIAIQQGGMGFSYTAPGRYNETWGDVYMMLFVEDDPIFRYISLPNSVTTETNLSFYVLTRYRHDDPAGPVLPVVEQQSACEAVGRRILHELTRAGRCDGAFSIKGASAMPVRDLFSNMTVGFRYEVIIEDAKIPACDFIDVAPVDVCAFDPALITL